MNGKMVVKVTLNEATDPDLFAYLMRFDNVRLRAGAFRAMASAAVRASQGERARPDAASYARIDAGVREREPIPAAKAQPTYNEEGARTTDAASPPAPSWSESPAVGEPRRNVSAVGTDARYDTDAIGEQFAKF